MPRFVTMAHGSPADKLAAGGPTTAFLQPGHPPVPEASAYRFSPLVSWLVSTTHPDVVVELGPGDEDSLRSTFEAALESENPTTCAAVLLPSVSDRGRETFRDLIRRLSDRFGAACQGYETEQAGLTALKDGTTGFLHIALFDSDEIGLPDLTAWLGILVPGAVVVVTTTAAPVSSTFAAAKQHVMGTYPAVSISLGPTSEAIVAQRPDGDATPLIDMLRKAPFAVSALLALHGQQMELQDLLIYEPEPSEAVRVLIGRVIDQQHAERDAFLSALRVYEDVTARLSHELVVARSDLTQHLEAARREREQLVTEFLDRVDELSAKVSTTASRSAAELAQKNGLLEAEGRKVEAYAGRAAVAESVLDDMRRSTSWRITAPVRLLSRMLARRAQPPLQPEN